jgi:flagellar basal-body rod protein FlgG
MASPGAANADTERPVGTQLGSGVRTVSVSKSFSQGTLENSTSPLDLAIEGEGFFRVALPDGTPGYTRDGSFRLSNAGQVVTVDGYPVEGFPPIGTGSETIDISRDGTVSVTEQGVSSNKGRIQLYRFPNAEGLRSLGHNLFADSEASGTAQAGAPAEGGFGAVSQYFLEGANVQIVREMVEMIASQRAYELNSKSIKTADEMLRMASNLR